MADLDQDLGRDASIGERLRLAREARQMTLEDVATQTRIPIRHLRAIEDGNWSELPAVTYTVGFARSYANMVGLDGAQIGREVRGVAGGNPPSQLAPVYYNPPDPARVPSRPLAWIAAVLAILLVGGYLWWRSRLTNEDQVTPAPVVAEQPVAQQPAQQPQAPPSLAGQQVTLIAAEDAWIQINDRAGGPAVRLGVLRGGERYDVPQNLQDPVLKTARPQVLRVWVGGRDLGALDTVQHLVSNVSLRPNDIAQQVQARGGGAGTAAPSGAPTPHG
jgi:cytoskeleton protein RodZ